MARPLRMDQEDTFYHVLNRGNERRAIFRDEHDYEGMAFGVKGSAISQACRRAEHHLQTDRRLRERLKSVLQ